MSCVLRVLGKDFAARDYAEATALPVITCWMRGEPRLLQTQPKGKKDTTSGVNIRVSGAGFTNVKRQIRDAVDFLSRYRRQLARLKRTPGVEVLTLDFGIADRNVPAQSDSFPPELVAAAGKLGIGITLSRYWISEEGPPAQG